MVDKYVRNLVRRQPLWVRELFKNEQIAFVMDDDGSLSLSIDTSLDKNKAEHAVTLISNYMEKYPSNAISVTKVH